MTKYLYILLGVIPLAITSWSSAPTRIIRTVDTSVRQDIRLDVVYGESLHLMICLQSYGMPVDTTDWHVMLHGQTNGQSRAESYQALGTPGVPGDAARQAKAGWISTKVNIGTWWPFDVSSGRWSLVATNASHGAVMRVGGPITVQMSAAADDRAPLPASAVDKLMAEIIAATNAVVMMIPGGGGGTGDADAVRAELLETNLLTRAQIAAATNHLLTTYFLNPDSWLSLSNDTLRLHHKDSILWNSSGGSHQFDPSVSNALWNAVKVINTTLGHKAPKAWGTLAPDGTLNPDPDYMLWVNSPALVLAGGCQWAAVGSYYALAAEGTVAFATAEGGEARFGVDLHTNYMAFVRGGSYIVGVQVASMAVSHGGSPTGTVSMTCAYTGGDFPTPWLTTDLRYIPWEDITDGVIWVDNLDGTATVTAPALSKSCFYMLTSTRSIEVTIITKPPLRADGGIFGNPGSPPVRYNSTITIQSGGKSYRIPAEEIK